MLKNLSTVPHINNIHEDYDLKIFDVIDIFNKLFNAEIRVGEEKIDGQNLTFTVRDGEVETFVKEVSWDKLRKGGRKLQDYKNVYRNLPTVKETYEKFHKALQNTIDKLKPQTVQSIFGDAEIVIECAIVSSINKNLLKYDGDYLIFIQAHALNPELHGWVNVNEIANLISECNRLNTDINFKPVPLLALPIVENNLKYSVEISNDFNNINIKYGTSNNSKLKDLYLKIAEDKFLKMGFNQKLSNLMAQRIVLKNKSLLTKQEALSYNSNSWRVIQEAESTNLINEITFPVEEIILKYSLIILDNLKFSIANYDDNNLDELREFYKKVELAHESSNISTTSKNLKLIDLCLRKINSIENIRHPGEGFIFNYKGGKYKITGTYGALNKLNGIFKYGNNPAKFLNENNNDKLPMFIFTA